MNDAFMGFVCFIALLVAAIVIGVIALTGCDKPTDPFPEKRDYGNSYYQLRYRVEVIDGCEYIASPSTHGYVNLCHKGNCTNSIHNYRVEK